jgi:hippurate hydrolase
MANVDMMKIKIKGQGGHGALPHTTKDPVSMAARLINDLQSIVSREISPFNPAVVTVGSIHGGTKGNVIPNDVTLELTLRSYSDEVRAKIIEAIERKCVALGQSAGIPEEMYPEVKLRDEYTPALYNDPELARRIETVFIKELGKDNVAIIEPAMVGEDFGRFGRTEEKVPILMYRLGAAVPTDVKKAKEEGRILPSLHSSTFAPDREATIKTGVRSMTAAALDLLKN